MITKQYKKIKPLVIGIGVAGKRHLEAQLNLGFKTGIYSINPQTIQLFKKNTNVFVFDNLQEAINWSNLVHVCTPDDKHTEFVAAALKKRKAVLCEKSFTTNFQDALKLQKLAHKNNCLLVVGQNYRLTPAFAETERWVLEGKLGAVRNIKTTYLHDVEEYQKRAPPRKNEDFLYIGGSHAVDLACWIANESVVKIQASAAKNKGNYPLSYSINLYFASGLSAHIELDASSHRTKSGTDLIVEGDKGKIISHNKLDNLIFYERRNREPQVIKYPNTSTFTVALEIKIIDEYLLGKRNSYRPIPDIDENINTIKILDIVEKILSNINYNK